MIGTLSIPVNRLGLLFLPQPVMFRAPSTFWPGVVLMTALETWEMLSYVVTVVGLPMAISVFVFEQRKERNNEEEEVYQLLSDNYQEFLRVTLEHPDLRLFAKRANSGAFGTAARTHVHHLQHADLAV